MNLLRGLVGVLVALAIAVGFTQLLELMLANAIAGRALQSLDDYALVLNTWPLLGMRLVVSSFMALLGGYVCAKLAEHDEMRYTLIAVIFRLLAVADGMARGGVVVPNVGVRIALTSACEMSRRLSESMSASRTTNRIFAPLPESFLRAALKTASFTRGLRSPQGRVSFISPKATTNPA